MRRKFLSMKVRWLIIMCPYKYVVIIVLTYYDYYYYYYDDDVNAAAAIKDAWVTKTGGALSTNLPKCIKQHDMTKLTDKPVEYGVGANCDVCKRKRVTDHCFFFHCGSCKYDKCSTCGKTVHKGYGVSTLIYSCNTELTWTSPSGSPVPIMLQTHEGFALYYKTYA